MRITVEYAAQIKRAAGRASDTFDFGNDAKVDDVLDRIAQEHGEAMNGLLFDDERNLHPSILLFIGDEQVRETQSHTIKDGEVLAILAPISGGLNGNKKRKPTKPEPAFDAIRVELRKSYFFLPLPFPFPPPSLEGAGAPRTGMAPPIRLPIVSRSDSPVTRFT